MKLFPFCLGGNQRDLARAKNQKKLQEQKKGNRNDGLTVEQRKQRSVSDTVNNQMRLIILFLILLSPVSEMPIKYEKSNRKRADHRAPEQRVENLENHTAIERNQINEIPKSYNINSIN